MPPGDTTVGTIPSDYPDALPSFTAQNESNDETTYPAADDPDWADGRDWNKLAAEIRAVAAALGIGARGLVEVTDGSPPTAAIAALRILIDGAYVEVAAESSLTLSDAVSNKIWLDLDAGPPAYATGTSWPAVGSTRWIPLAEWDDTGGSPVLTDLRPQLPAPENSFPAPSGGKLQIAVAELELNTGNSWAAAAPGPVVAVGARVTTGDGGSGGASTWDLGDGTDADRWGTGLALAIDTTVDESDWTAQTLAGGTLTASPDAGSFEAGFVVKVHAYYLSVTAPSS